MDNKVPAAAIAVGVLRCFVPAHTAHGTVPLCLTLGDREVHVCTRVMHRTHGPHTHTQTLGQPRSNAVAFEYRALEVPPSQPAPNP